MLLAREHLHGEQHQMPRGLPPGWRRCARRSGMSVRNVPLRRPRCRSDQTRSAGFSWASWISGAGSSASAATIRPPYRCVTFQDVSSKRTKASAGSPQQDEALPDLLRHQTLPVLLRSEAIGEVRQTGHNTQFGPDGGMDLLRSRAASSLPAGSTCREATSKLNDAPHTHCCELRHLGTGSGGSRGVRSGLVWP